MSLTSKLTTIAAAGAGSEPDLFISSVRSTTSYPVFTDIDVDSSGDIVTVGVVNNPSGAGGSDALILKVDASGSILWSKTSGLTGTDVFNGVTTDSSDNIYAAGYITDGVTKSYIQKVSASGTIAWEKTISSARKSRLYDCDISTDENTLFFGGSSAQHNSGINTSADGFYWGKVNTSDGSSLVDYIEGFTYSQQCRCVATDDDGSVVFGGIAGYTSTGNMDFFLRASQSNIGSTTEVFPFGGQQSAYVADVAHGPNNKTWAAVSGNRSWYFNMTNTTINDDRINNTSNGRAYGVVTDSLGNVYFLSYVTSPSGYRHTYINKFDDSFNKLWSRKLRGVTTTYNVVPARIAISNDDQYLYVCGAEAVSLGGSFSGFIFKFPTDGSLTGTYGDFVYEDVFQNIGGTSRTNRTNISTRIAAPLSLGTPSLTTATFTPSSTNLEKG
jgi:hypothetical protein